MAFSVYAESHDHLIVSYFYFYYLLMNLVDININLIIKYEWTFEQKVILFSDLFLWN